LALVLCVALAGLPRVTPTLAPRASLVPAFRVWATTRVAARRALRPLGGLTVPSAQCAFFSAVVADFSVLFFRLGTVT
jgi:hypothetical protein